MCCTPQDKQHPPKCIQATRLLFQSRWHKPIKLFKPISSANLSTSHPWSQSRESHNSAPEIFPVIANVSSDSKKVILHSFIVNPPTLYHLFAHNLVSPINCGRKPKYLKGTHTHTGKGPPSPNSNCWPFCCEVKAQTTAQQCSPAKVMVKVKKKKYLEPSLSARCENNT